MAEFMAAVLAKATALGCDEDDLRQFLQANFVPSFTSAAALAAVQTLRMEAVLVDGRPYRYTASGTADGARIIADADGRLYQSAGLRLIQKTVVASPVAAVEFKDLGDEFDLELWLDGVSSDSTSSAKLLLQTSADNGGAYASSGYHSTAATFAASTFANAGVTSSIVVAGGGTTTGITTNAWAARIPILGLGLGDFCTWAEGRLVDTAATGKNYQGQGRYSTARAENAFRVLFDTGNIDAGTLSLFGRS